MKPIIKNGDRYNRLMAIEFSYKNKNGHQFWLFKCSCGNEKVIYVGNVKSNHTKSCGCYEIEKKNKHGMEGTRTYKSWSSMKDRCLNRNCPKYKNWGGRGITVCKKWMNFENFYKDMGERPKDKSLDRIKNNLGYYKENCKWSTPKEQAKNRRNNILINK